MLIAAAWVAAGVRRVDPSTEIGFVLGRLPGLPRRVQGSVAVAPPGFARVVRVPAGEFESPLPPAKEANLGAPDGSRYGFVGSLKLRVSTEDGGSLPDSLLKEGSLNAVVIAAVREAAADLRPGRAGLERLASLRRDLESRLRGTIARRGLDLVALDLRAVDRLGVAAGERVPPLETRLLVIGLDGADWSILDPLLGEGRLPNLARLLSHGARGKLLTLSPMISPVVWTSVATGVEPERHGVVDFLVPGASDDSEEPVTSLQRRTPAVWEMLGAAGVPVGVVGWWASWPADAVRGYIVSDRVAYQLFGFRADENDARGKTHPADLYARIRGQIVAPKSVAWDAVAPYLSGPQPAPEALPAAERERLDEFRTLLASGETYLGAALKARAEFDPRFEAVYFEGTDTVGHLFMPYRPPRLPGVNGARFESFRNVVDRYYETVDGYLGKLLAGRGSEWTVMVLSDHGFATDATRPLTTDSRIGHGAAADWHRRFGIVVLSGAHVRPGAALSEASVYDIAPTILALFGQPVPASWPGRVLSEAIEPDFLSKHPVRFRPDDPPREPRVASDFEDPAAEDLREKLRSLGYLGAEEKRPLISTENNRGVALLAAGRFADAEAAFRSALRLDPEHPTILVNLGIALHAEGKDGEAERALRQAFRSPEARRAAGFQLAQIRAEAGDVAGAERILRDVLRAEPGATDARNALGLLLERRGAIPEAESEFREAARIDANAAEPRNNLARLYKHDGRIREAEAMYRESIEADPFFMGAYNNLALLYQDEGRSSEAIDLYNQALDRAPANAVVLNNLASLYYDAGDLDEARRLWERAREKDPAYTSPLNNLAGLLLREGRLDEAETLLRRAVALDPGYGDARVNLALVYRAQGRLEEARHELTLGIRDPRAAASAFRELGILFLEQGRAGEAIASLETARARGGDSPETLNPLGEALRRTGKLKPAEAVWRRSLEVRPDQPEIEKAIYNLLQTK